MQELVQFEKGKIHQLIGLYTTQCGIYASRNVKRISGLDYYKFIKNPTADDRKNACGRCFEV